MSKAEDLKMGNLNEDKNIKKLEETFKTDLKKYGSQYSILDFKNNSSTVYCELKSRRLHFNDYDTTIIGVNKIQYCNKPDITYYFAFAFYDGLYYIKYEKELFDTFKKELMPIKFRPDVGHSEANYNIKIPTVLLTKIN